MSEIISFIAYIIAWCFYSYSIGVILFIGKYIDNEESSFKALIWPIFDSSRNLVGTSMAVGLGLSIADLIKM